MSLIHPDKRSEAFGFRIAALLAAALSAGGGVLAWLMIKPDQAMSRRLPEEHHCALDGPPLRTARHCLATREG